MLTVAAQYGSTDSCTSQGKKTHVHEYAYTGFSQKINIYFVLLSLFFLFKQDFEAVPYDKSSYGKFNVGDSYIVLKASLGKKDIREIGAWCFLF